MGRRRALAIGLVVVLVVLLVPGAWVGLRARNAARAADAAQAVVERLRSDASALDFRAVAADLDALGKDASSLRALTDDAVWGLAGRLPLVGRRAVAARQIGVIADRLATAAAPLSPLLRRLDGDGLRAAGGRIDVNALAALGPVLSTLSTAAGGAAADLGAVDVSALDVSAARAVASARAALTEAQAPLTSAAAVVPLVAALLGSDRARTWFVALQNLAEARGTGGLVGAYAVVRADAGSVALVEAASHKHLATGPPIPDANLPVEFRQLWGADATEWAGLNLSPHFPYTGQLVMDGWRARGRGSLDGVVALDQTVVAALLTGTGPVTVRGVTIDSAYAEQFLTKDVYARFPVVADKDAVVVELVRQVFQRLSSGQVRVADLVKALRGPISRGRLLVYSGDPQEQQRLAAYPVAGLLPDTPGPFAMAVVNNGAGNKLDAYTSVQVDYQQGPCTDSVRNSTVHVVVRDGAPSHGLPAYVDGRLDLPADEQRSAQPGSTKVLLYVYGPIDSENALTTVDDRQVEFTEGLERGHTVWRIDLVLGAGQTRVVDVQMIENVDPSAPAVTPVVGVQPMAVPQVVKATVGPPCMPA